MTPDGKVINCGNAHDVYIMNNQKLFNKMGEGSQSSNDLIRKGWARIGILSSFAFVDSAKVTKQMLELTQDILKSKCSLEDMRDGRCFVKSVAVNEAPNTWDVPTYKFIWLDRPEQVKREYRASSRRRKSALPKSRNFLRDIPLEKLPWTVQKALDVLGLIPKKDNISANQFVSALRNPANEQLIQQELGRTSVEVIRDLNQYVQFDAPLKKPLAVS
jgi:hypothetical protein